MFWAWPWKERRDNPFLVDMKKNAEWIFLSFLSSREVFNMPRECGILGDMPRSVLNLSVGFPACRCDVVWFTRFLSVSAVFIYNLPVPVSNLP